MLSLADVDSVVFLGAHPDDIEIAAGGLMLTLAAARPGLAVRYVVMSGTPDRQAESRAAAAAFLPGAELDVRMLELPDGRLPAHWHQVKQFMHDAAEDFSADLVVSPWRQDAHQDHRLVAELVPTVFRGILNLQYEIVKWDGDLGRPEVYVPLAEQLARQKVELLHKHYPSQHARSWWDDEVFLGIARLRGVECGARYAEGYHCNKLVLTVASGHTPS